MVDSQLAGGFMYPFWPREPIVTPQDEHENVAGEGDVWKMTLKAGWMDGWMLTV